MPHCNAAVTLQAFASGSGHSWREKREQYQSDALCTHFLPSPCRSHRLSVHGGWQYALAETCGGVLCKSTHRLPAVSAASASWKHVRCLLLQLCLCAWCTVGGRESELPAAAAVPHSDKPTSTSLLPLMHRAAHVRMISAALEVCT